MDVDVVVANGGQAVRLVRLGVLLIADADQRGLQQLHDGGQHLFAWQTRQLQVPVDAGANLGECLAEGEHPAVLRLVADLPPAGVVPVLCAPAIVGANSLDVTARVGADPHVFVRRRDRQLVDPVDRLGIGDAVALEVEVVKRLALPLAGDAGLVVVDVNQSRLAGGHFRIGHSGKLGVGHKGPRMHAGQGGNLKFPRVNSSARHAGNWLFCSPAAQLRDWAHAGALPPTSRPLTAAVPMPPGVGRQRLATAINSAVTPGAMP